MLGSDRRYFTQWLRRTRRQLAPSGSLRQLAMVLAQREGGDADWHAARLRAIFDGHTTPSPDELTTIDLILARPRQSVPPATEGEWLL